MGYSLAKFAAVHCRPQVWIIHNILCYIFVPNELTQNSLCL